MVQLAAGDALLPRFVVFGSAASLIGWFVAVSMLSAAGRSSLEARDRVVVVGDDELHAELVHELHENPERPASVVAQLSIDEASRLGRHQRPLVEAVVHARGSVLVLSAAAQLDERIIDQAATLHEAGVRVRTRSLFYEEWLGKIPVQDLGRMALFFDIGEVHRNRYGRLKRLLDVGIGSRRARTAARGAPVGGRREPRGEPGPAVLHPAAGGPPWPPVHDLQVPQHDRHGRCRRRLDEQRRSSCHARSAASCG